MPDEDLTFKAVFEVNPYSVTWIVDGVETTETYVFNAKIVAPTDPVKTGYTFVGWDGYDDGMVMPASDLTFTAQWEINKHTASWIVDGVTKARDTYNYGDKIVAPADPEKKGYEFTGWTPTVATTMGDADLTYTATWKACEYEVVFLSGEDHGDVSESVMVPYGKKIADYAPEAFDGATNTEGQYIAGWEGLSADDKMTVPEEGQEFKYTAIWDSEIYNFNFVFGDENDVFYAEAKIADEVSVDEPERVGYKFLGWYDAEGNEIVLPMTVEKDYGENGAEVTFTAEWEALPFNAVFKANGGNWGEVENEDGTTSLETTKTIEFLCDEEIVLPADPVKTGYTFVGWSGYEEGATMPADDAEFVAIWEVKTFTVTFKYGGGKDAEGKTSSVKTLPYGATVETPTGISYEGYTFSKWSPVVKDTLDVESNLEYTAIWIANSDTKYTVEVYEMDTEGNYGEPNVINKSGTTNELGKAVLGEDYAMDADGQEIDAVLSTDSLSAPITADGKTVIKVYIARKKFDVYTEVDGVKEKLADYYYGATVAEPALEEKEGYSFAWEGIPEDGMPAEEVVIKGVWTVKSYTVTVGNAGMNKSYEFAYGENIVIPEPTRDGYTFTGWDKELPATMPAENLSVNAKWEKNS